MLLTLLAVTASDSIKTSAGLACAKGGCNTGSTIPSIVQSATTALVGLIVALSVLMIIVGGLRYVASAGDPKKTTDAKNTIMYAIGGVVVAIMAYGIVKFVTTSIK